MAEDKLEDKSAVFVVDFRVANLLEGGMWVEFESDDLVYCSCLACLAGRWAAHSGRFRTKGHLDSLRLNAAVANLALVCWGTLVAMGLGYMDICRC